MDSNLKRCTRELAFQFQLEDFFLKVAQWKIARISFERKIVPFIMT